MSHQVTVGSVHELQPGQRKLAFIDGRCIVVFNIDGDFHAIDNSCPHNGASLASGELDGRMLRCPAHGLRFDVTTGRMPGAGGLCVRTFPLQRVDGRLEVTVEMAS
jgi:3-phenylpropionate/trans-cinnamate dioxygenase ferredoxin subunit